MTTPDDPTAGGNVPLKVRAELRHLREQLASAAKLNDAQARNITALEMALDECKHARAALEALAQGQQRRLMELEGG